MTEREALKLALEALEVANSCVDGYYIPKGKTHLPEIELAITAIKEALAQPEQEPVATDWERIARVQDAKLRAMCNEAGGFEKLCEVMDKYERTTPPQRKPLTDEEFRAILRSLSRQQGWDGDGWDLALKEAIEAAHGITGEQK